mgnify:CR=1 FL=1
MKVPLSWLKDYVDVEIPVEELAQKLFSCGLEVEELVYVGQEIDRCVVGRIEKIVPHPDSDHLQICTLNCGSYGEAIRIVTGAHNIREKDLVPVALDGSSLAGGVKIKKGKLRGVESNGMLCSGEELGINEDWYEGADVNGILLLHGDPAPGTDIRPVVGLDDYVLDIAVTANRPDCQSVYGIAREVAALLGKPLRPLALDYTPADVSTAQQVTVTVEAPDLCPRYIAHYVSDLNDAPTPLWMRRRLALCGLRSIRNVVDITNFVLLEMGQPMHAFDISHLAGKQIVVRRAREGEKIVTLDEKEFKLSPENLVICDAEKPVALAGIMGGLNSEIEADTPAVLFECAKFERANVRRTSRALGQKSDSSARYEKGVDAYTTGIAINRALHLVEELGCGKIARDRFDVMAEVTEPAVVKTTVSAINALLGIEVPKEEIKRILTALNFSVTSNKDELTVTAPAYREDIEGYPDIAEEVIRMYGYDRIEGTFLKNASNTMGGLTDAQKLEARAGNALREQGYSEAITYSFISPKDYALLRIADEARRAIKIVNPIGEDMSLMRTTLMPSMLDAAVRNVRRGNEQGRLYELANIYLAGQQPITELPEERRTLGIAVWGGAEDFYTAKGAFEALAAELGVQFAYTAAERPYLHPGKCAAVLLGGQPVGVLGELAPDLAEELSVEVPVYLGELDYAAVAAQADAAVHYTPLPKFPEVKRDLALLADEGVTCAEAEAVIRESCKFVTNVRLFDVYRGAQVGEGKKSMAFSVTFTPREKAIAPEDADGYIRRIVKALGEKLGLSQR